MIVLYRISNNSNKVARLKNATKENCFLNFINNVLTSKDNLIVIADSINSKLKNFIEKNLPSNASIISLNLSSNSGSFMYQLELANKFNPSETILFQEDDYLYKPYSGNTDEFKLCNYILNDGLERAEYVSLYDHPDKYILESINNKTNFRGIDNTGVFITSSSHWKYVDSTTLTFATKGSTLIEDFEVWSKHSQNDIPNDFFAFLELKERGRRVATTIPGFSTHLDIDYLSPFYNWELL